MGAPYSTSVAGFSTVLVLRAAAIDPSVGPRRPDTIHTNYTPGAAGVAPDSGAGPNPVNGSITHESRVHRIDRRPRRDPLRRPADAGAKAGRGAGKGRGLRPQPDRL